MGIPADGEPIKLEILMFTWAPYEIFWRLVILSRFDVLIFTLKLTLVKLFVPIACSPIIVLI